MVQYILYHGGARICKSFIINPGILLCSFPKVRSCPLFYGVKEMKFKPVLLLTSSLLCPPDYQVLFIL